MTLETLVYRLCRYGSETIDPPGATLPFNFKAHPVRWVLEEAQIKPVAKVAAEEKRQVGVFQLWRAEAQDTSGATTNQKRRSCARA